MMERLRIILCNKNAAMWTRHSGCVTFNSSYIAARSVFMNSKNFLKRQDSPEAEKGSKSSLWMAHISGEAIDALYVLVGQVHLISSCISGAKEGLDLSLSDTLNLALLLEEAARETTKVLDSLRLAPTEG